MSRAVVQGIVSEMADAFLAAGLADAGTYKGPNKADPVIDCRLFITRGRQSFGQFGKVVGNECTITLLLSEISAPVRGATVVADGNTFTLAALVKDDDATSEWEVTVS
jgi:hypothetical protein